MEVALNKRSREGSISRGLGLLILLCLLVCSSNLYAQQYGFNKRFYIAGAFGPSYLNPDTEGTIWRNEESASSGFQVALGYDINPFLSTELSVSSLGAATVAQRANPAIVDEITYLNADASALLYLGRNADKVRSRQGLMGYLRMGFGVLNNTYEIANVSQANAVHVVAGVGVEYALKNKLSLRAEAMSFNSDMRFINVGLLYRFGEPSSAEFTMAQKPAPVAKPAPTQKPEKLEKQPIAAKEPAPVVKPEPVSKPKPVAKPKPVTKPKPVKLPPKRTTPKPLPKKAQDNDRDGVVNPLDRCPTTNPGEAVDLYGCPLFVGVIRGINFKAGSAELVPAAYRTIDNIAEQLLRNKNLKISISAHTDYQGDATYNMALSRKRAIAVARLLMARGIEASRLQARAYGESKPIADNRTFAGRRLNRRVEIHVIK